MGRIIAVANQKGGCAKTTTTVNLGAALALEGQKVLLVDYDPQCSLTKALEHDETFAGDLVSLDGYDLITGDPMLAARKLALTDLDKLIGPLRSTYDYILVDCAPSLSMVAMTALYAADQVIVTTQPHYLAVAGIAELLDTINTLNSSGASISGYKVLITMVEHNGAVREMVQQITTAYPCYSTQIRKNVAVTYSEARGTDVFKYDRRSNAAKDYKALALELLSEQ